MKNGEIIKKDDKEWIYINGAFYDNTPIKGNIKDIIENDISYLFNILLIINS